MAIAIAIPFPRPSDRASGNRPRRAAPVAAQPGARVYSPYGRRRLARPMAVPRAGAVAGAVAGPDTIRSTGSRLRSFFRTHRG